MNRGWIKELINTLKILSQISGARVTQSTGSHSAVPMTSSILCLIFSLRGCRGGRRWLGGRRSSIFGTDGTELHRQGPFDNVVLEVTGGHLPVEQDIELLEGATHGFGDAEMSPDQAESCKTTKEKTQLSLHVRLVGVDH